ncbi:hypothetical protein BH09SUM1_BH09SUM1_27690 [soil metagenome]
MERTVTRSASFLSAVVIAAACAVKALAGGVDCNTNGIDDSLDILNISSSVAQNSYLNAQYIGPNLDYAGTTVGSTNDMTINGAGNCGTATTSPDVWYAYVPDTDGQVAIALCGSEYDTVLTVINGTPTGAIVACNDDFCGVDSQVTFTAAAGTYYLVRIAGYQGGTGLFKLVLTGPASRYGQSVDGNGNHIPDDCETSFRALPNSLNLTAFIGDGPTTASLLISNPNDNITSYTLAATGSGISVSPDAGDFQTVEPQELIVSADPTDLSVGNHNGFVTVSDNNSTDTLQIPVNFQVRLHPANIDADPLSVTLTASQGGASPADIPFPIRNIGQESLTYGTFGGQSWISVTPSGGVLAPDAGTTVTVRFNTAALAQGNYSGYAYAYNQTNSDDFVIAFVSLTVGPPDCNGNHVEDILDIANGTSRDANENNIPDECEIAATPTLDANNNGVLDSAEPAGGCIAVPFFEGFDGAALSNNFLYRSTADGRLRFLNSSAGTHISLDDRLGAEQVLLTEDFGSGADTRFTVRTNSDNGVDDYRAQFNYDYSTYDGTDPASPYNTPASIPLAPRSADGETTPTALRLEANGNDALASSAGVTVFPNDPGAQALQDYSLTFDLYMNFAGSGSPTGGTATGVGTTQFFGSGLSLDATHAIRNSLSTNQFFEAQTAWFWALDGDGGSGTDYDYFEASADDKATQGQPTRASGAPNWWNGGAGNVAGNTAPWLGFFNNPTFEQGGSPGKRWITVELVKLGEDAYLYFTPSVGPSAHVRTLVAQWKPGISSGLNFPGVPTSGVPFITYYDPFPSITGFPHDQFALIDNVKIASKPGNAISSRNDLTFCAYLTGQTGITLEFDARINGDQVDTTPSFTYLNYTNFNGVSISGDKGFHWHPALLLHDSTNGEFRHFSVDLNEAVSDGGIPLSDSVYIRFTQFGNNDQGGIELDNIRLTNDATPPPTLEVSPDSISVTANFGATIPNESFTVRNAGYGALNYTISEGAPWLSVSPTEGSSNGEPDSISVAFDATDLKPGGYTATITVQDVDSTPSLALIPVSLQIIPPQQRAFTFSNTSTGAQGWTFLSPDLPGFTQSSGSYNPTNLSLDVLTTGSLTFAFWESPDLPVGLPATPPVKGFTSAPDTLYRTTWNVNTDLIVGSQVPTVRVRTSALDFRQSDILVSTSENIVTGAPNYSPTPFGKTYVQYFTPPQTEDEFRLDFDVINDTLRNSANARLSLRSAKIEALALPTAAGTELMSLDFTGSQTNGFTPRSASPIIAAPQFQATAEGLQIVGGIPAKSIAPPTMFGFWGCESTSVTLQTGKLYRFNWTVTSSDPGTQKQTVPAFRLRLNTQSYMLSAITQVDSRIDANNVPLSGVPQTYSQWLLVPSEANAEKLIYSFDYLYVPDSDDNPDVSITLQTLTVTQFTAP